MCAAMPRRFVRHPPSDMCVLSAVVFGSPPCVNTVCVNIVFFLSLSFAVGWCLLLPVSCGSRVLPLCLLQCRVCFCGGGLLGLGQGHQARKSTEISHTSWRIFKLFLCIQCIDIVWEHTISPPGQPGAPPRVSLSHTDCSPSSHWRTHRGARTHDHTVKSLALCRLS